MKRLIIIALTIFSTFGVSAQTLSLDSCRALALRNNAAANNAELEIEIAKQIKMQALTKYFPKIELIGGAFHAQKPIVEVGIDDINNATLRQMLHTYYNEFGAALGLEKSFALLEHGAYAGVTAFQPIFAGGQIANGNRLAKLGVEAAQANQTLENQKVIEQVDDYFWLIVSLEEKQKTVAQAGELLDTILGNVSVAVESGLATKNDFLKVKLKQNELLQTSTKVEHGLALAKMALCQICGIDYSDSIQLVDFQQDNFETPISQFVSVEQSVAQRTESQLLDLQVRAEDLKHKMIVGATLPQIGFGASYSFNNAILDRNSWNGMLFAVVKVPLTDWWETGHKLREQTLRRQMAENSRRDLTEKMALQTQKVWNELQQTYQQWQLSGEAVETARQLLDVANDNYNAGLITLSELLETQTAYQQTIDQRCDHAIAYRIQLAHYQRITGK